MSLGTGTELAMRKVICWGSELRKTVVMPDVVGCIVRVERLRNTYDNVAVRSNLMVKKSSGMVMGVCGDGIEGMFLETSFVMSFGDLACLVRTECIALVRNIFVLISFVVCFEVWTLCLVLLPDACIEFVLLEEGFLTDTLCIGVSLVKVGEVVSGVVELKSSWLILDLDVLVLVV